MTTTTSINRTARWAGALYLAMAPFALFGVIYVPSTLVVPSDASATARNIMASEWLFRAGTVSLLVSQVIFILLAMRLYRLLGAVSRELAALMVILVLVQVPILCLNELNHLAVLDVLGGAAQGAFSSPQVEARVMQLLRMRESGILLAQVFMGLWLVPLGLLVVRSGFLPRLLGALLLVSGVGYVVDWLTQLLSPGFPTVSQFTFWGELLFALWLLVKGVDVERWQGAAAATGGAS